MFSQYHAVITFSNAYIIVNYEDSEKLILKAERLLLKVNSNRANDST
jgi:hypothetical protein